LNGTNVSSGLQFSGSATDRAVTYRQLATNVAYVATITASNSFGNVTETRRFDTFASDKYVSLTSVDGISYSGNAATGAYRVFLRAGANAARKLTLHKGTDTTGSAQGVLRIPATGS